MPDPTNASTDTTSILPRPRSADKFWRLYEKRANWEEQVYRPFRTNDMDNLIIFAALFSAVLAALLSESFPQLSPDSGDVSAALLLQISQQLAAISNGTPVILSAPQSSFTPPASAIRVNIVWFISLMASLACALGATLVKQWNTLYENDLADETFLPFKAKRHAYISNGRKKWGADTVGFYIPVLLHLSLLLFVIGLVDFLWQVSLPVSLAVLVCAVLLVTTYLFFSVHPLIFADSPYGTPVTIAIVLSMRMINVPIRRAGDDWWSVFRHVGDVNISDSQFATKAYKVLQEMIKKSFQFADNLDDERDALAIVPILLETVPASEREKIAYSICENAVTWGGVGTAPQGHLDLDSTTALASALCRVTADSSVQETSHVLVFRDWMTEGLTALRVILQPKNRGAVPVAAVCARAMCLCVLGSLGDATNRKDLATWSEDTRPTDIRLEPDEYDSRDPEAFSNVFRWQVCRDLLCHNRQLKTESRLSDGGDTFSLDAVVTNILRKKRAPDEPGVESSLPLKLVAECLCELLDENVSITNSTLNSILCPDGPGLLQDSCPDTVLEALRKYVARRPENGQARKVLEQWDELRRASRQSSTTLHSPETQQGVESAGGHVLVDMTEVLPVSPISRVSTSSQLI